MRLAIMALVWLCLAVPAYSAVDPALSSVVRDMRESPRGPFSRIRWFCRDGTVLPPKPYACREHGGGVQHGQWSPATLALREDGYLVANLLAGIDPDALLALVDFEDHYAQLLIEKFLMAIDNGWIFEKALFYRGAIQEEDERAGGRALLLSLAASPDWLGPRFVALRTGVKLLPHGQDSASIGKVRQWSAAIADDDRSFAPLRVKIHGSPDAGDAARVREYARKSGRADLQERYEQLASEIDDIYSARPLAEQLTQWSAREDIGEALQQAMLAVAREWADSPDAGRRLALTGLLLADIRSQLPAVGNPGRRLELLDLGLRLETEHFSAAAELRPALATMSRAQILGSLQSAAAAAYGTGVINARLYDALRSELNIVDSASLTLTQYRQMLAYLGRAPSWGVQGMRRYFYPSMIKLTELEPKALLFIQDQLRASPMLFYSTALDVLLRDAGQLAGIKHQLFDRQVGVGLHALNPGLARGVLHTAPDLDNPESFDESGIYLLPETVAELPPVGGIITAGAGNPLSHVQLLARNLGIPNVSMSAALAKGLLVHDGQPVVMAVSAAGLVELSADGENWNAVFGEGSMRDSVKITPDLKKLDLSVQRLLSLEELSADDSGRTVGPKAAKLAELRKHFPEAVSRGLAIPFGLFRDIALGQAHVSGSSLFDWMQGRYVELDAMAHGPAREEATEAFRRELYNAVLNTPLPDDFVAQLQAQFLAAFGDQDAGVFVRSDTNVEDLAGFTGAGLNLTLPNVVGLADLLDAIPRVWASPFTRRAFSWRQSHMTAPQHVYTSILLLESVSSDKSGVMVTADIDSGARDVISVAVNEGLGGAVDGQAAESLRINLSTGDVRVLATATAPWRRTTNPEGGILKLPASGSDTVLQPGEIAILRQFAADLPNRFPPITDEVGQPAPADVEFGFLHGQLHLFQLRPFLDSKAARSSQYLQAMDAAGSTAQATTVDLQARPLL